MRLRIALSILGTMIAASTALAGGVQWRADFDEALEEAKLRNVPVVVIFMGDGAGHSAAPNALARYLNQNAVPLIGQQETAHGTSKIKVRNPKTGKIEQKEVCSVHGTVSCAQHKLVWQQTSQGGGFTGNSTVPAAWVASPAGKILFDYKKVDAKDAGSIKSHVVKAAKQLGKGITYSEYTKITRTIDQGKALSTAKKYMKSIKLLNGLKASLKKKKQTSMVKAVDDALAMIDIEGHKLVDEAEGESSAAKRKKLLTYVKTQFKGLESGDRATKALEKK